MCDLSIMLPLCNESKITESGIFKKACYLRTCPPFILILCDFYASKLGKSRVQQILLNVVQVARNANGLNRLKTKPNGIIRYYEWCSMLKLFYSLPVLQLAYGWFPFQYQDMDKTVKFTEGITLR